MEVSTLIKLASSLSSVAVLSKGSSSIVVMERGARIIAATVGDVNVLWVNPDLQHVVSAGGWNVGGLRLWVSPERRFFYRDPRGFKEWFCPATLDPGSFKLAYSDCAKAVVQGRIEAVDQTTGWRLSALVRRDFHLADECRLIVREAVVADYPGDFNLWVLAQVPPSQHGTVIIPVKSGAKPIHYFGRIPEDRLLVGSDHISFRIDGKMVCKLGIAPEDLRESGRAEICYIAELEGTWITLIMRTFDAPLRQEECLDVAKADPSGPKGCVQSYNSGPEAGFGSFGEIELHFKPAVSVGGRKVAVAEYEVMFMAGEREEVVDKVARELQVPEPNLF